MSNPVNKLKKGQRSSQETKENGNNQTKSSEPFLKKIICVIILGGILLSLGVGLYGLIIS